MAVKIVKLDHIKTETTPVYGGTSTTAKYDLTTDTDGMHNHYEIEAEIRGIATGDPHMHLVSCVPTTNNENTIHEGAIEDLLGW